MTQVAKSNSQDLLEILVAVAWIDGEIQPEEKRFLETIAREQNISSTTELQALLANYQGSSLARCYQLLEKYLGTNPDPTDYQNLLTAVSKLIYSDNDIATEEATLLTQIQNLNPHNSQNRSTFDKAIKKIQKLYQLGLSKHFNN